MLNPAQLTALNAAIVAETDPAFVALRTAGSTGLMAEWLNSASATVVWKTSVPKNEVGKAFQSTALAAITSGNNDKLANFAAWNDVVDPSRADQRGFFDDVFSVAAGATTRASLLALWKRFATRAEAVFATGTGTDAAPAMLTFQGAVSEYEVVRAINDN